MAFKSKSGIEVKKLVEQTVILQPDISLSINQFNVDEIKQAVKNNDTLSTNFTFRVTFDSKEEMEMVFGEDPDDDKLVDDLETILITSFTKRTSGNFITYGDITIERQPLESVFDVISFKEIKLSGGRIQLQAKMLANCTGDQLGFVLPFLIKLFPKQLRKLKLVEKRTWYRKKVSIQPIDDMLTKLAAIGWNPVIRNNKLVLICKSKASAIAIKRETREIMQQAFSTLSKETLL